MNSDFKVRAERVEKGYEMVLERGNEIFNERLVELDAVIEQLSKAKKEVEAQIEKVEDSAKLKTVLDEIEKGISKKTEERKSLKDAFEKFCADIKSVTTHKIEYCHM